MFRLNDFIFAGVSKLDYCFNTSDVSVEYSSTWDKKTLEESFNTSDVSVELMISKYSKTSLRGFNTSDVSVEF